MLSSLIVPEVRGRSKRQGSLCSGSLVGTPSFASVHVDFGRPPRSRGLWIRMSTWIAEHDPDPFASLMAADSSAANRTALACPEMARAVRDEFVEAVKLEVNSVVRETVLF